MTLVLYRIGTFLFLLILSSSSFAQPVRAKGSAEVSAVTPFTLLFPPEKNGVILESQRIDYDLTEKSMLRMGPYFLLSDAVSMQMTREQGEFFETEFGLEVKKRMGSIYVMSFRWPLDFIKDGVIEIINEKGESYWQRTAEPDDIKKWQEVLDEKSVSESELIEFKKLEKGSLARPKKLDKRHNRSAFGLAHKGFFEIPIAQIKEPFRFCVSKDDGSGRVAVCSRKYEFYRSFGQYGLRSVSQNVRPRVLVNDKEVTLKGTAVFLDFDTPIKFSAQLEHGTYYEFISKPKEIKVVDLVFEAGSDLISIVGYGDQPIGQVEDSFYADTVYRGFLNFMPTIGDLKKYWRATVSVRAPFLYVKGEGGAPFRQTFTFDALPTVKARVIMNEQSQKATYSSVATLVGKASPDVKLSSEGTTVERLVGEDFSWDFLADQPGQMNMGYLTIEENKKKWQGQFEIFRGFPAEISARLTGIASLDFDLILLGEIATQYWFEKILGWDSFYFSKLRWGLAAKYFKELMVAKEDPVTQAIVSLSVMNLDLKYRFTPGIWGRDPTTGAILAYQSINYGFRQSSTLRESTTSLVGAGLFWARSMPRIFDDIFNVLPIFRYPKWVDMEVIYYPVSLEAEKNPLLNLAFNFHGKVQWSSRFFGEAGFGLKTLNYEDPTIPPLGKKVGLGLAYATVGIGLNF